MTWQYLQLQGEQKILWAESELRMEKQEGIHTVHLCKCKRQRCRKNKCVVCWQEEIRKLKKEKI